MTTMLLRTVVFLLLWLLLIAGPLSAQNKTLGVTSLPEGTRKRAAIFFANQDYKIDQYDLTKEYNDADDMKAA